MFVVLTLCSVGASSHAQAVSYESVDLGIEMGSVMIGGGAGTTGAADFGIRGAGTVTLNSPNSANFFRLMGDEYALDFTPGSYTLANGDSLSVGSSVATAIFHTGGVISATFSLASGSFQAGDVLLIGGLVRHDNISSAIQPGSAFGGPQGQFISMTSGTNSPLGTWLPSDLVGLDPGQPIYGVAGLTTPTEAEPGLTSTGAAFRLTESTSSFTVKFTLGSTASAITPLALPGHMFSIGMAMPVPEPSGVMLLSLSGLVAAFRRRR